MIFDFDIIKSIYQGYSQKVQLARKHNGTALTLTEKILLAHLAEIPVKPEVMEPAHPVGPEVLEPAHWFDPVFTPPIEEAIMITVIDEIYPELRLIEKIASIRERRRRPVFPEVQEPAHYRQFSKPIDTDKLKEVISQLGNLLRNLGY